MFNSRKLEWMLENNRPLGIAFICEGVLSKLLFVLMMLSLIFGW